MSTDKKKGRDKSASPSPFKIAPKPKRNARGEVIGEEPTIQEPSEEVEKIKANHMDMEKFLNKLSKEELKVLFLDTFRLLTHHLPGNYETENQNLQFLLTRTYENFTWRNANYLGELINGLPNGKGKSTFDDGCIHEGSYLNGKEEGPGCYSWPNGDRYFGDFRSGYIHGLGTSSFGRHKAEGEVHYGNYKQGKMHGPGMHTFNNGNLLFSLYESGLKHGLYMWLNSKRTSVVVGTYIYGKLSGEMLVFKYAGREKWAQGKRIEKLKLEKKEEDEDEEINANGEENHNIQLEIPQVDKGRDNTDMMERTGQRRTSLRPPSSITPSKRASIFAVPPEEYFEKRTTSQKSNMAK